MDDLTTRKGAHLAAPEQQSNRRCGVMVVVIVSLMGNSSNKNINALQCIVGFFLESKCAPEVIMELLSHMGVSVSTQTNRNIVNSLTKSARLRNKNLPDSMFIYDNFNLDFEVAQATLGNAGKHISMTSATFAPYANCDMADLRFTKELHETSRFNKDIMPGDPRIYTPRVHNILPQWDPAAGVDPLRKALPWHLRAVLV